MLSSLVLPTLFTVALVLVDLTDGMPISYACTRALGLSATRFGESGLALAATVLSALVAFLIFGGGTIGILPAAKSMAAIGHLNHWLVAIDYVALWVFVLSSVISAEVCRGEYRWWLRRPQHDRFCRHDFPILGCACLKAWRRRQDAGFQRRLPCRRR